MTREAAHDLREAADAAGIEITTLWAGAPGRRVWNFIGGPPTIGLVPPETRSERLAALKHGSDLASWAGVASITTHVGFIPENPDDSKYPGTVEALRELAAYYRENGQELRAGDLARDQRFPGYRIFRQVHPRTNTPVWATVLLCVLIEAVLAIFAPRADALVNLFGAATLLPCLIYLATVLLYVGVRTRLPRAHGFSLGRFEWPVVALALIWLLFELSIFRDQSFHAPWAYALVMFGLGLIYFVWLLVARPDVLQTPPDVTQTPPPVRTQPASH
jgi:Amino acid permease